ncbi:hypothetical protein Tco_1489975 [Tanacetum coccineum]
MDLDSPEDDKPIIVEDEEEEESQNNTLGPHKLKAKAEVALLSAQPSFLNVEKLTKLLVKSLSSKLSKLLSSHDFSSSLSTELKELPSKFVQAVEQASSDQGVPSAGQASTDPVKGEKNTKQATITQLFKQRTEKDAKKANLNKQPKPTTPETTTIIPPIITSTITQFESPCLSSPSKSSPQPEGKLIKKDKGNDSHKLNTLYT